MTEPIGMSGDLSRTTNLKLAVALAVGFIQGARQTSREWTWIDGGRHKGACGYDHREGKGLWHTVRGEPYPTFYGKRFAAWQRGVRREMARCWLGLRPRSTALAVFEDYLLEQGLLKPHEAALSVALLTLQVPGLPGQLAAKALEGASKTEREAAVWASP